MRSFRDRDYVEVIEGLLFTVIGNVHPREGVIAYLKYVPSPEGMWGEGKRFKRALSQYTVPMLLDTISFLKQYYSSYVSFIDEIGIEMSLVPRSRIVKHYLPEGRLQEIIKEPNDELESLTAELAQAIADEASISTECLGVTGSILVGIHRPFSDIDLVVYGRDCSMKVKEALVRLYQEPKRGVERLPRENFELLVRERQRSFQLSKDEIEKLSLRKWNRGFFKGKEFSIHPVKREEEVNEVFGDFKYRSIGLATIRGVVADSSDSMFMPSRWAIEDVEILEGAVVEGLVELCSYEGIYIDILSEGEGFEARGKVEAVYRKGRLSHYRLLIGSPEARGLDYIKPLT